jgi:tRNA threonylcarbamoyladenosine biosynthesis protein TsaB
LPVNIVAFETSSETISVAVSGGAVVALRDIADAGQHSGELALPLMHQLLVELGLTVSDIDVVVFGQGPGAFTGVRVACGVAQGLAYGLGKRVIGLPSTLALAEAAAQSGADRVLVALDARMGEIYLAAYERSTDAPTGFTEILAPCLFNPVSGDAALLSSLSNGKWVGIGTAFGVADLVAPLNTKLSVSSAAVGYPRASDLLTIAKRMLLRLGDAATTRPHDAVPLYVRNKVAMTIDERRKLAEAKVQGSADAASPIGAVA